MNNKAFRTLSYGLYVIGSVHEGKINGQVANTVFQISSDPATIAIGINKQNLTNEFIKSSKLFSVSVLAKDVPLSLIGNFGFKSGRNSEKYAGIKYELGANGTPILKEGTVAAFEASVIDVVEVETHTLFIGKVTEAEVFGNQEPMTYAYYHQVKSGSVPPAAPTASAASTASQTPVASAAVAASPTSMKKYRCTICGYIYDPAVGDPDSGIPAGTAFEDIPADWTCPVCGISKDQFELAE